MPNWCDNALIIVGDAQEIERFSSKMVDDKFTFKTYYPYLNENGNPVDDDDASWYDWAVEHWGTKWDLDSDETQVDFESDRIILSFMTAWDPPREFVEKVSKDYPALKFHLSYHEAGSQICGYIRYTNGESQRIDQGDLEMEDDEPFCHFYNRFSHMAEQIQGHCYAECGGYCGGEGDCDCCDEFAGNEHESDDDE